jgi:hypothetical protein
MCRVAEVVSWAHCALVWAERDAQGRIRMLTPEHIATVDGFDTAVANLLLSALRLGERNDRRAQCAAR